jgi:hypothetical protein
MTGYFYILPKIKSSNKYIVFSQWLQKKLSQIIWESPTRAPIDPRWTITGVAQSGITDKLICKLDYLHAFVSIPIFSIKASEIIKKECSDDIDFLPCKVAVDDVLHDFMLARIHKFLPLIDHEATANAQKISIFAPDIFNKDMQDNFFMARDTASPTTLVCSSRFCDLCDRNKLNIKFSEIDSFDSWLARQPIKPV